MRALFDHIGQCQGRGTKFNKLLKNRTKLIAYISEKDIRDLSAKIYIQGDCKTFKFKWLQVSYHKMIMGQDEVRLSQPSKPVSGWQFPVAGSTSYAVLEHVCKNKGLLL